MSLSDGTRLGTYEITGKLGAGGMGEVYRATDTRLARDVAIKTLPASLADDKDRLARFEREARLLASLNHAHIAAVHSLDETDGTLYIVMELIEGESLEQRLKSGAIPLDDALQFGLQIASALEAAHEKGVVHRDLKPANIMITPAGVIKVLDFGLAKAFTGDGTQKSAVHSPALSVAMTQQGLVLGTAGYMSPEQASGQATDQRADVWAFGVVMYEMLTGQPVFSGESVPHILADVLKTTPDWTRLPSLHPRLELMLQRCLTKRPRDRYAGIADARVDIERALADPAGAEAKRGDGAVAPDASRLLKWPVAAAFVIGLIIAGGAVRYATRAEPSPIAQFDITPEADFAISLNSPSIAIAPDGQSMVWLEDPVTGGIGGLRLLRRPFDQLVSTVLVELSPSVGAAGIIGLFSPFFSPDGTQVAYYEIAGGVSVLKRVSIQGGATSTITELPGNLRGASWGDDGMIVFATADVSTAGLWRVRATGGEPEQLTTADPGAMHWWPEVLPGSEAVLFTIITGTEEERSQIAALSLGTGEQHVLMTGGSTPRYALTGHLLYGRDGTLFAVPFDARAQEVRGAAIPVRERVATKGAEGATEAVISANGTLLYVDGERADTTSRSLLWVDSDGRETPLPTLPRLYDQVVLSPNERQAAVRVENDPSVWIADLERGTLQRLAEGETPLETFVLFFSQDGRRIAYSSRYEVGRTEIVWRAIDGSGDREVLATFGVGTPLSNVRAAALTPDGSQMLVTGVSASNNPALALGFDVGVADIGAPESYRALISSPSLEYGARASPDGRWIAFGSNESGTLEVYVERFPDGRGRQPVTISGGVLPHWSADGKYLIFFDAQGAQRMMRLPVAGFDDASGSLSFGSPEELFPWRYYFQVDVRSQYDVTADGERFLVIGQTTGTVESGRMILVQNWSEELKRLVPAE